MASRIRKKQFKYTQGLDVDEILFDSIQLKGGNFAWEQRLESPLPRHLFMGAGLIAFLVIGFFTLRALWITVASHQNLSFLAQGNAIKEVWSRSPRGIIYSNDLTPLVRNTSTFNLVAIPAEIPREKESQEHIIAFLENSYGLKREYVAGLFSEDNRFSFRPLPLLANLSQEEALLFKTQGKNFSGLRLEENFTRTYPSGRVFSHLLGYSGLISSSELKNYPNYLLTDIIGKSGLELEYEESLRGVHGKVEIEVNSTGKELGVKSVTPHQAGKNLILFVDAQLQQKMTEVMERILSSRGFTRAAAVAIDPRSGGILALQSFPLYDNNVFAGRLSQEDYKQLFENSQLPLLNRAISGLYPSGSTIKPFIATAALEENVINEKTTIQVARSITVAGQEFRDLAPPGPMDVKKALALSSNVFFYTVGGGHGNIDGLGPYRINDYLSRFGFGKETGIDLPGEQSGFVPDPDWKRETRDQQWFIGDTYNLSIGQGDFLTTPIGLALATAAIANRGSIIQPRIVKAIADSNLESMEFTTPHILNNDIASPQSIETVREGMRQVVTQGSARSLLSLPVSAAGKTGTAQAGTGREPHAWFSVFAPYENPQIVLVIMVENGGGGSAIALPVANEILRWYFKR